MSQFVNDIRSLENKSPFIYAYLSLLSKGNTRQEICWLFKIKTSTYKSRMRNACEMYGARTYYQLLAMAIKAGVLS